MRPWNPAPPLPQTDSLSHIRLTITKQLQLASPCHQCTNSIQGLRRTDLQFLINPCLSYVHGAIFVCIDTLPVNEHRSDTSLSR